MPVAQIDGAGSANGPSIGGTFDSQDSPFGGRITMTGIVANPSNLSLEYRVMIKAPSDPVPKAATTTFQVAVTTIVGGSITFTTQNQVASGDWFSYIPQNGSVFKSVAEDLLYTFQATEEGLHTVYVDVREVGNPAILATSATEAFLVDNTAPTADVEITNGTGNCGKFAIGDVIIGTYSTSDAHHRSLTLTVTPTAEAAGGHLDITALPPASFPPPSPGPTASNGLAYPLSLTTTGASGDWRLDTTGMEACGFNIRLDVADRTIVNSGYVGWTNADTEGFCLE